MKKLFKIFAFVLIAALLTAPAYATTKNMWAYVYRWKGLMSQRGEPILSRATSGITFKVLQRNSDTAETLYEPLAQDTGMTSLTNPVTTTNFASNTVCNDQVAFRVDPGEANDTYVDLIVVDTTGGYTAFVEDFDEYTHTIVIDERPGIVQHGMIWFTAAASETDTGIDFDYDTMVQDVRLEITTGATDPTDNMDVGLLSTETNGDADGFIKDFITQVTGYHYDSGGLITRGSSNDYYGTSYYGTLLSWAKPGATAWTKSRPGGFNFHGHIIEGSNAVSLTYTNSATGAAGYIHYWITRLR